MAANTFRGVLLLVSVPFACPDASIGLIAAGERRPYETHKKVMFMNMFMCLSAWQAHGAL